MRSAARWFALLPLFVLVLARPAHADPMDNFSITSTGLAIDFSLPASTTGQFEAAFGQDNFGQVSGTVNGVNELIGVNLITGMGCAECQTILVNYDSTNWTILLPATPLYNLTPAGAMGETLTFNPGDYMTDGYSQPFDYADFEIKVTPGTAATPEPPTIFLFAAAGLGGALVMRRRALA